MIRTLILALAVAIAPAPVNAQTAAVDSARASGVVGERFDGFLGFASEPSGMLRAHAGSINIKRRALYAQLATQRGATVQDVGITAGCTLLARVPVGGSYMLMDGVWRRRAAGAPAPVPDYCR